MFYHWHFLCLRTDPMFVMLNNDTDITVTNQWKLQKGVRRKIRRKALDFLLVTYMPVWWKRPVSFIFLNNWNVTFNRRNPCPMFLKTRLFRIPSYLLHQEKTGLNTLETWHVDRYSFVLVVVLSLIQSGVDYLVYVIIYNSSILSISRSVHQMLLEINFLP